MLPFGFADLAHECMPRRTDTKHETMTRTRHIRRGEDEANMRKKPDDTRSVRRCLSSEHSRFACDGQRATYSYVLVRVANDNRRASECIEGR